MQQHQTTLDVIYENWQQYNAKLHTAIAPLTAEHPEIPQPYNGQFIVIDVVSVTLQAAG